ncbi:hypothetical protein [Helicobacter canis]|uniref:Uncharacterized protein n=1 Tax=Helicobacter canis TaxID=29419 RepID=A0A377JLU9_9HELI|nr:hypothetical protein [Helicobacter canis]STP06516.1 Uncharacterised protein [Helicobacter canis]
MTILLAQNLWILKKHRLTPSGIPCFSKEATLCHTTATAAARNDRRNAESQKVDSSNAQSVFSQNAVRRRILVIKMGLCKASQGRILERM